MKIKSLHLLSADVIQTAEFYGQVLQLPVVLDHEAAVIQLKESTLHFHPGDGKPQYHVAFTIPENKIEEALNWISSKAPIIPIEPGKLIADFSNWNAHALYFSD